MQICSKSVHSHCYVRQCWLCTTVLCLGNQYCVLYYYIHCFTLTAHLQIPLIPKTILFFNNDE